MNSIDYQSQLFDPIYSRMGVAATIITNGGRTVPGLTAIDHTNASPFVGLGGIEFQGAKPTAYLRMVELLANNINYEEDLKDGQLIMNESITRQPKTWTIGSLEPKPTPKGIADGEIVLLLRDDANV